MELIVTTIIWAAVFQGFLLGLVFVFSKKHRSFSNKLLGFFLITFVFNAVSDLISFGSIGNYEISRIFATPEVKLLFPVLFLHYVLEKIGRTEFFRLFLKIHYILAFAIVCITLVNVILFFTSNKSIYDLVESDSIESFFMIQQYYAFLLTAATLVISIIETKKYKRIAKNEFTDLTMLSISWLWQFIFILVPIVLLWGTELTRILLGGFGQSEIVTYTWALIALAIYFISFKAFLHRDLFDKQKQEILRIEKSNFKSDKNKSGDDKNSCEFIKDSMESGKYFLNQDLTIHEFAKAIKKSPRLISTCINQSFGFNFNEWVNNYRVDNALEILKDKNNNHLSIEGVGSDSGFKSRSAMYIAFKKKTGKTPGFFRPES